MLTPTCTGSHGSCDLSAIAYVFGRLPADPDTEGRLTIVGGPRGRELAVNDPSGARCADCAFEEFDLFTQHHVPAVAAIR